MPSSSLSGVCSLILFPLFATGVNVVDTGGKLPPASLTPAGKFAAGIVDTGGKFATGVNNTRGTGGKFAAGVVDTGGNLPRVLLTPVVHIDLRISPRIFEKIRNDPNVIIRGLGQGDS